MNQLRTDEKAFYERLGAHLEKMRKSRRLSVCKLSRMIGVHRNTLERWESNLQTVPLWGLLRIADCFGCTLLALIPQDAEVWPGQQKPAPVAPRKPPVSVRANIMRQPRPRSNLGVIAERDPWIHSAGERKRA